MWPVTRPPAGRVGDRGRRGRAARGAPAARHRRRRRPLRGGGGRAARFAEALGDPRGGDVGRQGRAHGTPWLAGGLGVNGSRAANELARDADVVLCAGTRLSDFTTGSHSLFQHPDVRFVGLNVNAADAHKLSADPVVADAREDACEALRGAVARRPLRPRSGPGRGALAAPTSTPTSRRARASRSARARCCG